MRALTLLRRGACVIGSLLAVSGIAFAQSDNPSADLSLDPDQKIDVVYAVYGGIENQLAHYKNVTDQVTALLQKSPHIFSVTEEAVLGAAGTKEYQSLIIVYNYQERSYFYNMPEGGGEISLDKLKDWAKIHPSHVMAIPAPGTPDSDFRAVFATYGVAEKFVDVTDLVKKLLRDQPDGFYAHEDAMGGDPHWGWQKALVIIFDDASGRHFYAQVNNGAQVNKAVLLDAAKSN